MLYSTAGVCLLPRSSSCATHSIHKQASGAQLYRRIPGPPTVRKYHIFLDKSACSSARSTAPSAGLSLLFQGALFVIRNLIRPGHNGGTNPHPAAITYISSFPGFREAQILPHTSGVHHLTGKSACNSGADSNTG